MKKNRSYKKQEVCYICKKRFSTDDDNKKYHKVRDHCHCTGKFREAAHSICNMSNVNPCSISEWFYIWLSFYNQRASKKNWGSIWMPRRKCREIY